MAQTKWSSTTKAAGSIFNRTPKCLEDKTMSQLSMQIQRREFLGSACALAGLAGLAPAAPVPANGPGSPTKGATTGDLFATDRLHEIQLEIDPADWALLRERYLENDWYWCRVQWNGINVKAAVRSRGNGSRNPVKPSLRLSFKSSADSGPFLDQETLVLGNMVQDSSLLKNPLAYSLFAKMGIPAPRLSYARVSVNGIYWGLYQVCEDLDTPYVLNRLGEKDGYLYEYKWVDEYQFEQRGQGRDNDYIPEPFELKNNSKNPNPAPLMGLIETINTPGGEGFWQALAAYGDPNQWLTFLAVETLVDDRDGLLGNWGLNGFFLYNYARSTRFALLPWDKDWSFFRWDRPMLEKADGNVLFRRLLETNAGRDFFRAELARAAAIAGGPGGWLESEARRRQTLTWKSALDDQRRVEGTGPIGAAQGQLIEFTQRRVDFLRRQL